MLDDIGLYFVLTIIAFVLAWNMTKPRSSKRLPVPPGPKGYPIVGNMFDIPKDYDALFWMKHKELYGMYSHSSSFIN